MIVAEEVYNKLGFHHDGYKTSESFLENLPWYKLEGRDIWATQSSSFGYDNLPQEDLVMFLSKENTKKYMLVSVLMMEDYEFITETIITIGK